MSDLIDRQALIDAMAELQGRASTKAELKGISKIWKRIKQLPSAQIKIGRWIENEKQNHVEKMYHCSECGFNAWGSYEKTKFCGGCGLRMENAYERSD